MKLRPYQSELIDKIRLSLRNGHKAVVAVLGCGGGKSVIQGSIAKSSTDKGRRVLFLVHRKELCQQIANTFRKVGVDMSLCDVSMVQTVSRRLGKLPDYDLIITDEAHHSTANTYRKIYDYYHDVVRLGFTATPLRLNKGGLGEVYTDLITSVSTQWLIENHYLAPYKYYSVKLADTSHLHTVAGEFKQDEVAELMQNKEIYGDTVKQWKRLAEGKKTIVYCATVEAAKMTAERFSAEGYSCLAVDGNTPKIEREKAIEGFRSGEVKILCNCELFGEGLDVPDCECVVLLRPTQSLTLFIQQSMRSMRYMPNKTAIIIDHVGNCYRHGLPDDEREWSLEPKHKQENIVKIRECKECFSVYPPTLAKCPYCGAVATTEIRKTDKKTVEVDLVELQRTENLKNTPVAEVELKTWEEIREFQKLKGYKFPWCFRYATAHGVDIPKKYDKQRWLLGL
ncbi:MAG: DEAD/DEAH box helicase [Clostridia bacterium]|nr:DEAD/DEAH box helicase [Clostridia bacterium]